MCRMKHIIVNIPFVGLSRLNKRFSENFTSWGLIFGASLRPLPTFRHRGRRRLRRRDSPLSCVSKPWIAFPLPLCDLSPYVLAPTPPPPLGPRLAKLSSESCNRCSKEYVFPRTSTFWSIQ